MKKMQNSSTPPIITIRLQKLIAASGYASRREAENLIMAGKVEVNGETIKALGLKFPENAEIKINGNPLKKNAEKTTVALFKPAGYACTKNDPFNAKTIYDLLPKNLSHLAYAGRLDKNSEGLVILSNDGDLIQKLSHPKFEHIKEYEVTVKGSPKKENLAALESGKLKLDNYQLNPVHFKILETANGKTKIKMQLSEGRKREIRRLMDSLGFPVLYLLRTKIADYSLDDLNLQKGEWKILKNV